jgi:hypothetical protein
MLGSAVVAEKGAGLEIIVVRIIAEGVIVVFLVERSFLGSNALLDAVEDDARS